ncbi:MAG: hypothetical protein ACK55Z_30440, partial [bacterium]
MCGDGGHDDYSTKSLLVCQAIYQITVEGADPMMVSPSQIARSAQPFPRNEPHKAMFPSVTASSAWHGCP